jgi:hypothetical protein
MGKGTGKESTEEKESVEKKQPVPSVEKKQLGLNVPVPLLETLQGISATSGITMTQLLATALEMVTLVYQAEARGGLVLVHNNQGEAESMLTVPRQGVHQISLASLKLPSVFVGRSQENHADEIVTAPTT